MAQWIDIPLTVTAGELGQTFSSDIELSNLRAVDLPPGSGQEFAIEHDAAIVQVSASGLPAVPNAAVRTYADDVLAVVGGAVYATTLDGGTFTSRGGVSGAASPRWTGVFTGTHAVFIESGVKIVAAATSAGAATSPAFPAGTPRAVAYQDGYTIYSREGTDEFYISALDDPTTIGALDFSTADALPGDIVGLISDHRELVIFKESSIEFWSNTGGTFPFSRSQPGVAEVGLASTSCVVKHDNMIYFLGNDLRIYELSGYLPRSTSGAWVDAAIRSEWSSCSSTYRRYSAMKMFVAVVGSDRYVCINRTDGTGLSLWMNSRNGLWHKHESSGVTFIAGGLGDTGKGSPRGACMAYLASGDVAVATLALNAYADQGAASQPRTMTLPMLGGVSRRLFMHEIAVHQAKRTAAGNVTVSWSDDGGATYSTGRATSGAVPRLRWVRLGSFFSRIVRLVFDSGSPISVRSVSALIDSGG